jgi:hypothetical protein
MPAIVDEVYEYRGYHGCESRCRIRIYRPQGKSLVIIASEEADQNPGTSITNMAEQIATDVSRIYGLAHEPFIWIEHYDDRSDPLAMRDGFRREAGESFDRVEFRRSGTRLTNADWHHIAKVDVEALIGESLP